MSEPNAGLNPSRSQRGQNEPCNAAVGIADAEYVLLWLKQSGAPENVIGLQERALRIFIATDADRTCRRA